MKKTLQESIKNLQNRGFEVKICHARMHDLEGKVLPRGGFTRADIFTEGHRYASGLAECSDNDNYNKKIGANIALGRAIKLMERT